MDTEDVSNVVPKKNPNGYKVMCGRTYPVFKQMFGDKVFYKVSAGNFKSKDGMEKPLYKSVSFWREGEKTKDTSILNGSIIRPLKLYESCYFSKNNPYEPIWTLVIQDWEIVYTEEQNKMRAIDEYKRTIDVDDMNFDDNLPF